MEMMLPSSLLLCLSTGDYAIIHFCARGLHKPVHSVIKLVDLQWWPY